MSAFSFEIKNGQVQNKALLRGAVKNMFLTLKDGKYAWPHPEIIKHIRSIQQNRYYHGVVCKLVSDHTGYTGTEIHQIFADKFLSYEKDGRKFVKSTTELKTTHPEEYDFENYMEDCRSFAAMELHVYVPLPNEPNNYYYDIPNCTT